MFSKAITALIFIVIFASTTVSAWAEPAPGRRPSPVDPPRICECSECGMFMEGEALKSASEVILKGGKTLFFCDLGDLFTYLDVLRKKHDVAAIYVRDGLTGGWVDGRAGYYLSGAKAVTPMRYGIIAFRDRAAADGLRKKGGGDMVYTFDAIMTSRIYRR